MKDFKFTDLAYVAELYKSVMSSHFSDKVEALMFNGKLSQSKIVDIYQMVACYIRPLTFRMRACRETQAVPYSL